jgi:cholesterol oxidase
MHRLSSPIVDIRDHYDVVVVGSGYGGSIAASRLARAGRTVCLLERGREILPGEYPDTELEALAEIQMNLPHEHKGSKTGLFYFHLNDDMSVAVGCGLGGTSLINASVAVEPDPRVFEDVRWPEAFRQDVDGGLATGYQRAKEMLKPTPYPEDFPRLPKLEALRKSAQALNGTFVRLPINVTFQDGVNHVGVRQHTCQLCGDCASGCNHGAKNTTLMNYLPDAKNHGAEIFTEVSVRTISRLGSRWRVSFELVGSGAELFDAPLSFVSADVVLLAAGAIGSTEILLRSARAGLPLSDQVGRHFSGNGDVGGAAYNCDVEINALAHGPRLRKREPVGPTITSAIDLRNTPDVEEGMLIEEGAINSPLGRFLPQILSATAKVSGVDTDAGIADLVNERRRELESLVFGAYRGAVRHSQIYLVMAHDDSGGRLTLEKDRVRVRWPGVGEQPFVRKVNDSLTTATRGVGGTFIHNPLWKELTSRNMVTAHPLGGCAMGEDGSRGAVDHKGRVFSGNGADVHDGLYVCDAAVIPRSLGANPLLTISAIAERNVALLAEDRGWEIDYALEPQGEQAEEAQKLGIQFTETMGGFFSTNALDDYQAGWDQGKAEGSPFKFVLTILADDLEQMIADPDYTSRLTGTVSAPALSPDPLAVTNGRFNLFLQEGDAPAGRRRMRYRMRLTATDGKVYYFDGFKLIKDEKGLDLWSDTTTLYITVHEGADESGPVRGRGILRIYPRDFQRQIATTRVRNATSLRQRLEAMASFGRFFGGSLYDIYGGVFARRSLFDPQAPLRKRRPLRADAPEVHFFETDDGARLRLTRYRGGDKGPVMLVHGLGVSSLAFALDTIETNMVEYLVAHGYDVWLLDYRSSIELSYATTQYTADDVALRDWPAAVAAVRAQTGADDIQVVVHCYGAITFMMAMLAGLQGVRSAVCSQVGAHIRVIPANRIRSGLYLDRLLERLSVDNLSMYTDATDNWLEQLYNKALGFYPVIKHEERCNSPVCHRVTFLYAPLYKHDQLNNATHDILHELFGPASISNFRHLGVLTRKGYLVTAQGEDSYLPRVERLAIPIAFIHGAENETWTPESTAQTYDWLCEHNGSGLYSRHLIANYGHIDCIFGRDAATDVYPFILQHLQQTA